MALIKLSDLLEKGMPGITSKKVKLVRHADTRKEVLINNKVVSGDPYTWYINNPEDFLAYQSEQKDDVFKDADYIVSFIGEEGTTARMIGVFKVEGYDDARRAQYDSTKFYYKLSEVEAFKKEYSERIIIDWGKGTQNFHHWLRTGDKDKDVIAIEKQGVEWKYPGYEEIIVTFGQLRRIINGNSGIWKHKLSAVKGIYVISDDSTGKLYVGSATRPEGIWGRWKEYADTGGHGGNVKLEGLIKKDPDYAKKHFHWGILQTCSLGMSRNDVLLLESVWKNKLGREACALNGN